MVGCTLPRASAVRALSEGREGQLQGSSSGCLAAQIQRHTESTRLPGPLAGVFSPAHTEADSLGAQKVYDRRRFPSTLLPSRDMCRWLGPDPACLGSCVSGFLPTAPTQGKQPLRQDLLEEPCAPA